MDFSTKYNSEAMRQKGVEAVNQGRKGAIGITRSELDKGSRLEMITQLRRCPIMSLSITIRNDDGEMKHWSEEAFDHEAVVWKTYDEEKRIPMASFAIFEKGEGRTLLSTDNCTQGIICIIAAQPCAAGYKPFAVNAVFDYTRGISSLITDGDEELAHHFYAVAAVTEKLCHGLQ